MKQRNLRFIPELDPCQGIQFCCGGKVLTKRRWSRRSFFPSQVVDLQEAALAGLSGTDSSQNTIQLQALLTMLSSRHAAAQDPRKNNPHIKCVVRSAVQRSNLTNFRMVVKQTWGDVERFRDHDNQGLHI